MGGSMITTYKDYIINARAAAVPDGSGFRGKWVAMPPIIQKIVGGIRRALDTPTVSGVYATEQAAVEAVVAVARRVIDRGEVGF